MSQSAFSPFSHPDRGIGLPDRNGALGSLGPSSADSDLAGMPWSNADRLTLSFAPDGTKISKYTSDLYTHFKSMLNANQLEAQIIKAFQIWGRQTNVNVGLVNDQGLDFGVQSLTQGSKRFGDIRIGAIPMAPDVYAIALRHDAATSGSWGGDILFNTNAPFTDAKQFFAVALHEAGHVLGLKHNSDPTSVMNPATLGSSLNGNDIAAIRAVYGERSLDLNEDSKSNNVIKDATRIENSGSLAGRIPYVVFGDLATNSDVDYFQLPPLSGYSQAISFKLVSRGISLLRAKVSVYDEQGALISSIQSGGIRGAIITVTIPNAVDGETYFARVESADASLYSTGSYALITTFDANVIVGPQLTDEVAHGDYALLRQSDVRKLFLFPGNAYFNQELQLNDTFALAEGVNPSLGFANQFHYQINGSFSYANDVDFFSFKSPDVLAAGSALTLTLDIMEPGSLVPHLRIFDAQQNLMPTQLLINGNGQFVIQLAGAQPNEEYFVQVSADLPNDAFSRGNYSLTARFDQPLVDVQSFGANSVSDTERRRLHTLYVAETQMFHFSLTASNAFSRADAQLWMTIYDINGNVVYRNLTNPGQTRTTQSVILRPGSYVIHVNLAVRNGAVLGNSQMAYSIDGFADTDPVGPELLAPIEKPFKKASPTSPDYVYPGDRLSPSTYLLVNGREVTPPPGSITINQYVDANGWYWTSDYLGPVAP